MVEPMKACPNPWCAKSSVEVYETYPLGEWAVRCKTCGKLGPRISPIKGEAVRGWNTRPHQARQPEQNTRLQKQFGLALEALEVIADGDGPAHDIARQTMDDITRVGMEAVALETMDRSAAAHPTAEVGDIVERFAGHTPGPWFSPPPSSTVGLGIVSATGRVIADVSHCMFELESEPEDIANARLMAAGPELLDLIQSLQSRLALSDENVERAARALWLESTTLRDKEAMWAAMLPIDREGYYKLARSVIASLGGVG